jgi:acetylornithine deacetylase
LVLTSDEEVGCIGASHVIASELIKPRRVVIGEPTSLHPARAGKGYCLAEVTVYGEEAHSAHPQKGRSAIYRAARLITAIEDYSLVLAEEQHALFSPGFTTLNIGTIAGGTAKNIIPGECTFQLEWRPIPGQQANTILNAISALVEILRRTDPSLRYDLRQLRQQTGFESAASSSLVQSIERMTGRAATSIAFGSEASLMASLVEEVIVFGPGDMQTAHSSREYVPLAELDKAVECLRILMTKSGQS